MPIPVTGLNPVILTDLGVAAKGPGLVTYNADFTAAQTYVFDFTILNASKAFGPPRSIYIDNSQNPNSTLININGSQDFAKIPAFAIGMLPIAAQASAKILVSSNGGAPAGTTVTVEFYNYERPPYVYQINPISSGAQVEALVQSATSLINRNFNLLAATAHDIFPAVATSRQVRFRNVGNGLGGGDNAFWQVNVTATGVFDNGDTLLQVGESFVLPFRTAQRISFFSTAGTRIEGMEWSD